MKVLLLSGNSHTQGSVSLLFGRSPLEYSEVAKIKDPLPDTKLRQGTGFIH